MPQTFQAADDTGAAIALARALVVNGYGALDSWRGDPALFMRDTLEEWVATHAPTASRWFQVHALVMDSLTRWSDDADQGRAPHKFYIAAGSEPGDTRAVVIGPTLELLAEAHERFPSTFYSWFCSGIRAVVNWFDWQSGQWQHEMLAEMYDDDDDQAQAALTDRSRDLQQAVPRAVRKRPMSEASMCAALRGKNERVKRLMLAALATRKAGDSVNQPKFTWPEALYVDWMDPWPTLVIANQRDDATIGAFDEYSHDVYHSGSFCGPSFILELDISQPQLMREAIAAFFRACAALEQAAALLDLIEHPNGRPLVEVLT